MKILKTLAVFFVLLVLTVGAVAEVKYEPFKAGDITLTLPTGLKANVKNCETPGEIEIEIDSVNTNWSSVVAKVDDTGSITFSLKWALDGNKSCIGTTGFVTLATDEWSFEAFRDAEWGYEDCYEEMTKHPEAAGTSCYAEGWVAEYDVSTNVLVPSVYDGKNGAYLMAIFYDANDDAHLAKYASIRVTHSNENAFQAKLNYVPKNRIVPSSVIPGENTEISDGNATYTLAEGNTVTEIETRIVPPAGAAKFIAVGCEEKNGAAGSGVIVKIAGIGTKDYYNSKAASVIWYDDEGNVLLAERLDMHVSVGEPKAWPNYITDENVTKADVTFVVGESADDATSSAIKAAHDKQSGTVNVYGAGEMPSADMTKYMLFCKIKAPAGATHAAHATYEYIKLLGSATTADRYRTMEESLNDPVLEPVENGVFVYTEELFKAARFAADAGLEVYYDKNSTADNTGDVTMIDWYDADGKFMSRQWIAKTYAPLAQIKKDDVKKSVPANAENPLLIYADAGEGFELQVASYPQTSENGMQLHYELTLLKNGVEVPLDELSGNGVELFIPYPDSVNAVEDVTFMVNHYDATGKVVDNFVEESNSGIALTRVEGGVLMTIKSLSPFVLSWEEVECEHEKENLFYERHENMIRESCKACENHTAVWHIWADKSCVAGTELVYEAGHSEGWLGGDWEITFVHPDAMETFDKTPTEPGEYELVVTFANEKISMLRIPFTVTAAPAMPTTGDNNLPLATLMGMLALALTGAFMLRRKVNG